MNRTAVIPFIGGPLDGEWREVQLDRAGGIPEQFPYYCQLEPPEEVPATLAEWEASLTPEAMAKAARREVTLVPFIYRRRYYAGGRFGAGNVPAYVAGDVQPPEALDRVEAAWVAGPPNRAAR